MEQTIDLNMLKLLKGNKHEVQRFLEAAEEPSAWKMRDAQVVNAVYERLAEEVSNLPDYSRACLQMELQKARDLILSRFEV